MALKALQNKKACCRNDDIPIYALEYIWDLVKYPLWYLYNLFLKSGEYPDGLKIGEIIPFYKKGDVELIENYRPITGLLSFSKIFEKILTTRFESYLNKKSIIVNAQHGFRNNHSTNTAAFDFMHFIYTAIDNGNYTLALFFDLTRAFDCIDSDILIKKLHALEFRDSVNKLYFQTQNVKNMAYRKVAFYRLCFSYYSLMTWKSLWT